MDSYLPTALVWAMFEGLGPVACMNNRFTKSMRVANERVETWGHCLTLYYSNLWYCCRRSKIDPSAYGKLFVKVQSQAMTPFLASGCRRSSGTSNEIQGTSLPFKPRAGSGWLYGSVR